MIKNYLILFMSISFMNISAQISCPDSIKTSGQSSPSSPIFTLTNGQNGCNENWPATITVNGSLTYNFVSCSGGNLKYEIQSGQTPPSTYEMTADFGSGVVCSYDASGNLVTLSNDEFKFNKVIISPNPVSNIFSIKNEGLVVEEIKILNISGQVVMMPGNNKDIDISGLNNGLYFAKILTNKGQISKKIVKN